MNYFKVAGDDGERSCEVGCRFQPGLERTEQSVLTADGAVICGKRGTKTYLTVDRPTDTDDGMCRDDERLCYNAGVASGDRCPLGVDQREQIVCPGKQGLDNLVCAASLDECPINHVVLLRNKVVAAYGRAPSFRAYQYELRPLSSTHTLAFSRRDDARPLTDFKLDFEVCMNSSESTAWPAVLASRNYYPGERLFNVDYAPGQNLSTFRPPMGCTEDLITGQTLDDRYSRVGLKVSEYDLQQQSGVLAKLRNLRNVDVFYQGQFGRELQATLGVKHNYTLQLYVREALFFSRRCEVYGNFTRQEAAGLLRQVVELTKPVLEEDFFKAA